MKLLKRIKKITSQIRRNIYNDSLQFSGCERNTERIEGEFGHTTYEEAVKVRKEDNIQILTKNKKTSDFFIMKMI